MDLVDGGVYLLGGELVLAALVGDCWTITLPPRGDGVARAYRLGAIGWLLVELAPSGELVQAMAAAFDPTTLQRLESPEETAFRELMAPIEWEWNT